MKTTSPLTAKEATLKKQWIKHGVPLSQSQAQEIISQQNIMDGVSFVRFVKQS
jgi:hypothetical protein